MNYGMWIAALALMCRAATVYADEPQAPTIAIPLRRGAFPTYHFVPRSTPKAIIIFGSGDGGWSQIENRLYAGWSMGAVQAVAASGDLDWRSPRLVGLVLMSMDQCGRYGLRLPEQIGLEPDGEGTFGVADFTAAVANLRVAQMSALDDWMNNTDWIKTLKSSHRLYELEHSNHDFNGVDDALQTDLLDGITWILNSGQQNSR